MDNEGQLQPDDDIRNMGLEQMRREKVLLTSELKSIDSQISDLAFNNYGTYADAGRATHDCSKTFGEMRDKTVDLSVQAEELTQAFQDFRTKAKVLAEEQELVKKALDKSNPIWELLTLPSRMDVCIRAGYYDLAYSLTNYGIQLQQQPQMMKNALIKKVADRLVEARSYLLEELFNKFAGPLDLAESIKVINNVRKMPYLTANQLRMAVLQHRDIYLDKKILDISGNSDMIVQAIEIYRTCMYDTLVLYVAVFPDNEIIKRDESSDPRWESWPVLPPSSILSQWAISNIKRLLEMIQIANMKSAIDLKTIWSKLMTTASSFGRMGIDFRPLIASKLTCLVEQRFQQNVQDATKILTGSSRDIVMLGIDPSSLPRFETRPDAPPVPSPELSLWDDITVYANHIVDSLNNLRLILTPVVLSTVVLSLRDSVRSILSWLVTSHLNSPNFSRAVQIVCTCLTPFFEKCVAFFFPPAAVIKIFGSSMSKNQYLQFIEFDIQKLAASCDGADKIEEIVKPLLQKRTLADIDLESVLKNKGKKEPTTFFLETPEKDDKIDSDNENDQNIEDRQEEVKIEKNEEEEKKDIAKSEEIPNQMDDVLETKLPEKPFEGEKVEVPEPNTDYVSEQNEEHSKILVPNQEENETEKVEDKEEIVVEKIDIEQMDQPESQQDTPVDIQISSTQQITSPDDDLITASTQNEDEEGWGWDDEEGKEDEEEVNVDDAPIVSPKKGKSD